MKIGNKAPLSVRGRNKEATAIEQSVKALIKKYGLEIVRFVSNKVIGKEVAKKKLKCEIAEKERELNRLKKKAG